jgi:hypothetical protein
MELTELVANELEKESDITTYLTKEQKFNLTEHVAGDLQKIIRKRIDKEAKKERKKHLGRS